MIKALISYSHKDKEFLDSRLLPDLRAIGVEAWTDRDIVAGEFWIDEVETKIREGDWLIVLLSDAYQDSIQQGSGACRVELNWIVNHIATVRNPARLIVLWQAGELPTSIQPFQAIDIRGDSGALTRELRRLVNKVRPEPQPVQVPDPDPIPQPTDDDPRGIPELARHNFDVTVERYHVSLVAGNAMQARNAVSLLSLLDQYYQRGLTPKADSWLDAGCGTGLVPYVAEARSNEHGCGWLVHSKLRGGFDYAPRMVWFVNRMSQRYYTHIFEGDLRVISRELFEDRMRVPSVELIIANNVIHWLFRQETIIKAFGNCRDVIKTGGLLAASVAAVGTGMNFLKAYKAEMEEALDDHERDKWRSHLDNPIGLQTLHDIVTIASRNGFSVEDARLVYEPVKYKTTDDYVNDAKNYGEKVFMAPLLKKPDLYREEIWNRIKRRFHDIHLAERRHEAYVHDQFMIYLIARRFG